VPASTTTSGPYIRPNVLPWSVRGGLLGVTAGLVLVFAAAGYIRPYDADGQPLRMSSHEQLGLPACNFVRLTGKPCPSCGMTTSFALLAHGDVANSLRANYVGTALAVFCVLLVPWNLFCAWRGRYLFIRSAERALLVVVGMFLFLMLLRWGIVLGQIYLGG
jgi:Protein of unknown function (DUF2752)